MEHRIKLWVGVGAYVLTSASPTVLADALRAGGPDASRWSGGQPTVAAAPLKPLLMADAAKSTEGGESGEGGEAASTKISEGGEGGEGGEAGAMRKMNPFADAGADERFVARLMLMKSHLRIARELGENGHPDLATPHVGHALNEVYEAIEADLEARRLSPFEDQLESLMEPGEKGSGQQEFPARLDGVLVRIDQVAMAVESWRRNDPEFVLKVALALLKQAALDYEEAVVDGAVVNAGEYQDGRGFVLTARDLVYRLDPVLGSRNDDAWSDIRSTVNELLAALPGAVPPASPRIDAGAFYATVSRIELAASRFL